MKIVIQRVSQAKVIVEKEVIAHIQQGLLVLLGIETDDSHEDITWLINKIVNLRIFDDDNQIMNLSVKEVDGNVIVVSQFTLHASTKKGNRPSYIKAARPETAIPLYEKFVEYLEVELAKRVQTGKFGAHMLLDFINDGPVTIIIDSKNRE